MTHGMTDNLDAKATPERMANPGLIRRLLLGLIRENQELREELEQYKPAVERWQLEDDDDED